MRDPNRARAFYDELTTKIRKLPGVTAAGGINLLPPSTVNLAFAFTIDGRPSLPDAEELRANFRLATEGYFKAVGVAVIAGRTFQSGDTAENVPVIVVNQALANRFLRDEEVLGRRISVAIGMGPALSREIVGVVADVRQLGPKEAPRPEFYLPYTQETFRWMTVAARTSGDLDSLAAAVRQTVRELDSTVAVDDLAPLALRVSRSLDEPRFRARLFGSFAVLALALAVVGVTGVTAYALDQRGPEMSLRLALGADPRVLLRMILADGLKLTMVGAAGGVLAALALARVLGNFTEIVPDADPTSASVAAVAVSVAAVLATWLPASRASRADAANALR